MKRVLIIGNGISRLQYAVKIRAWKNEIWCCNYAFVEYGSVCSRVAGHEDVMEQAALWRDLHCYDYRVMGPQDYTHLPTKLRGNSGVFLVSQALDDCYDEIILAGFDFGGKDVWTPLMDQRAVEPGLQRKWEKMLQHFPYAKERISFWPPKKGYDELDRNFQPIYMLAEKENIRLRQELMKHLGRKKKYQVVRPKVRPVTEKNRGSDYYNMILKMGKNSRRR